ncbi:MAG: HAD-IA family hydrolase [Chromatiaceae bacterium]|nr:HAD-IA family hydrolase [Chromatiaceae bacterium]
MSATSFGHVRLICFDLDDTLWPCRPVIDAAEAESYRWLGQRAPGLVARFSLDELRAHRLALADESPEIAHDLTAVRLRSLAVLLNETGYAADLADQSTAVFRRARNRVTPYHDVLEALAALRPHYTLVSVTNGNSQIEHTPLHDSFDISLTAAEVGAAKPHPEIFHAASRRSGIPLQRFLHVGDDPVRDVQAARALGLATVWVNRDAQRWPRPLPPADLEVGDLATLVSHLLGEAPS